MSLRPVARHHSARQRSCLLQQRQILLQMNLYFLLCRSILLAPCARLSSIQADPDHCCLAPRCCWRHCCSARSASKNLTHVEPGGDFPATICSPTLRSSKGMGLSTDPSSKKSSPRPSTVRPLSPQPSVTSSCVLPQRCLACVRLLACMG